MALGPNGALTLNVALMAVLLSMLGAALRSDFDGGHLVALVAAFTAGSLMWVLLKENVSAWGGVRNESSEQMSTNEEDARTLGTKECWLAIFYTVLMFVLVYVLGTLPGCVVFVSAFLLLHRRGNPWAAIFLALLVGGVVPYLLAAVLDARLWEGVIPEIVPGWVGGGVAPPL